MTQSPPSGRRLALAVALASAAALLGTGAVGAPHQPDDPGTVLERLPRAAGFGTGELQRLRAAPAGGRDPAAAVLVAGRFFALGQTTQDPRYIGHAQAVLQPWWTDADAPQGLLVLRAAIKQNRHQFAAALADLDLALHRDASDPQAWAQRAAVLLVLGRPAEALTACGGAERRAASLAGTACRAAALARLGRAEEAFALLDLTLARSAGLDPALERWARVELAEIARLTGRHETAAAQLRAALAVEPADAAASVALADLLLDQGRPAEALAAVEDDPAHDGKLLRAALAAHALGEPAWRDRADRLEERFAAAQARGDALHRREEARFRLHLRGAPAAALALAQANWREQREPPDARVLLEAARAAGAPAAAEPVLAWLGETGLRDPGIERARRRLEGDAP